MRKISKIVLHCTASPDHMDVGFKEINNWHKARGWMSTSGIACGYHYIIRRNGEIERGRPDNEIGAHAYGVNSVSLGIVWVGTDKISPEQEESMKSLNKLLMNKYNIDIDNVQGHCEAVETDKTCPNLNMDKVRAELIFVQPKPKVR